MTSSISDHLIPHLPQRLFFLFPLVIRQREADAFAQLRGRDFRGRVKDERPIAVELKSAREHFAKGVDERRLAMEVHGVLAGLRLDLIDADQAAAARCGREVARLAPLQGFFQMAHASSVLRGGENQRAKFQDFIANFR